MRSEKPWVMWKDSGVKTKRSPQAEDGTVEGPMQIIATTD